MLTLIPAHYSLHGLYNFLFDSEWRNECYEEIEALKTSLEDKQQRLLKSYQRYYETIFAEFDDKVQAGVKATIAQVLAPFNHPELIDAFCTANAESINLEDVLNGQVFIVDMPLSRWGLGAKVVYTFIKLRFFNLMQSRVTHSEWNQNRFVFFLCDEYQEIVSANKDGLSDLNFWDKSRSSKTIGIISTQSISSFYAAVGDRDMANALLQNFRQKICFRTEDETTIALMNRLLGMVEVQRITKTQNSGNSSGQHSSSHSGESTSLSTHDKPLLDGQFFRTLPRDHALVLLSIWGNGCDDVLKMEAVFS
jgi:type IV secretory pathway TraG/TraD family ATPase VirD4